MCQLKKDGGRCKGYRTSAAIRQLRQAGDELGADNLVKARARYGNIVTPMSLPVPTGIAQLLTALEEVGDPLLVGGTVRDSLAPGAAMPKDFDIEVHGAEMDAIARTLRSSGYRVDEVGKSFGVLKAYVDGEDVDVSVPRRDSLQGEGHKGFSVELDKDMTVTDAAERRDFTINAMMYSHQLGACIDPWGGREDVENGVLRHVSDAFGEDPLRPLRGFQFAGRYKLIMDPVTVQICKELLPRAHELPTERIRTEWSKFYGKCVDAPAALGVLRDTGWDQVVGGIDEVPDDAVQRAFDLAQTDGLTGSRKTIHIAGVMASFMDSRKSHQFLRRTVVDGDRVISQAGVLAHTVAPERQDRPHMRQWARTLGKKDLSIQDWERKEKSLGKDPSAVVTRAKELGVYDASPVDHIMGRHVIEIVPERKPGPWIAQIVSAAQEQQDAGKFITMDEAMAWLATHVE